MNPSSSDAGLTFDWPVRGHFSFLVLGCVFLSFLAHIATFFVFQVVYPQRVTIPPPPPQVSLLTPSSPENEALLRWIEAEDPALVASAHSVAPPDLLTVPYRPSFATLRLAPLGSVETSSPVPFPPARDPLAIIRSVLPRAAAAERAPASRPSSASFSAPLAERPLLHPAEFQWPHPAAEPLGVFQALIGVESGGRVRFVFLQQSSGNEAVDQDALVNLQRVSFAPSGLAVVWAMAEVTFGSDAYLAPVPAEDPVR